MWGREAQKDIPPHTNPGTVQCPLFNHAQRAQRLKKVNLETRDCKKKLSLNQCRSGVPKPGCLHVLRGSALLRSFAHFSARLRSFADWCLRLICVFLRSFACFCERPRLERPRLGTPEQNELFNREWLFQFGPSPSGCRKQASGLKFSIKNVVCKPA